ncbi:MAG: condensation domain-containing protein [Desulfovibrionales bacterium]|nr:condensation domain-containing protein [Desulfovibrionales bacterium]
MNSKKLVQQLVLQNWRFWIENGRLRYKAPKNEATDALLKQLKARKQEIISLINDEPRALDVCPLSYGQRALWFLWKLSPQSTAYNQSLPLGINCEPDMSAWQRACALLVAKHPMLRTIFPVFNGEPIQQLQAFESCALSCSDADSGIDWVQANADTWSQEELQAEMKAAHQQTFDLEQGPLIRFRWYSRGRDRHILLITMHHIVCDGWSLEIIYHDITTLYHQAQEQGRPEIQPGPNTYQDFVRWQQKLINGPQGEHLWAFWRTELAQPLPVLELPLDYPRPVQLSYEGDAHSFSLGPELSQNLKDLAAQEQVTLYELCVTAYLIFLHRLTGQDDVLIGSPTSGRSRPEFSFIVGYFVDPVVIRANMGHNQTIRQFISYIRQIVRQSLENSDFPFALLVEKLQVDRQPNRSPLFDASMNYISTAQVADQPHNLEVIDMSQADGKFDMTLNISDGQNTIHGSLGFNTNLFTKQTISMFAESLLALLQQMVLDPDQDMQTMPLLRFSGPLPPPVLLGPAQEIHDHHFVQRLFEDQVERYGQNIAVQAQSEGVTYAQLNVRANALAWALKERGMGPESLVALGTGRTVDFITGLLGVLKAGAAYLPLDPDSPLEMIGYMLDKARVSALVIQNRASELASYVQPLTNVHLFCLDSLKDGTKSSPLPNPCPKLNLDHPAYVMFTSGSTGKPKGVEITHRNLSNYLLSILADLNILPARNFALVSALNADMGNTMIFPSLGTGGCLHIFSDQERLESMAFARAMQDKNIDYLKIVPSHLEALLDSLAGVRCLPTQSVILGGESCPQGLARDIRSVSAG